MNVAWEGYPFVSIDKDEIKIVRKGHMNTGELSYEGFDPETFELILAKGKIPVKQGIKVSGARDAIVSPVVMDVDRLKTSTDYEWKLTH